MKTDLKIRIVLIGFILFNVSLSAQTDEWKTATNKNGNITAKYNFSTRVNEDGNKVPLVEKITTAIGDVSLESCITLMKNISEHKEFRGEKSSKPIKIISENEWIIYYYKDGNLLLPAVDGAYVMIFEENEENRATFTITADPTLIDKTGASRISYAKEIYSFQVLENDLLKITISTSISPSFKVPVSIMKKAFPKRLFDNMEKFLELVKNDNK